MLEFLRREMASTPIVLTIGATPGMERVYQVLRWAVSRSLTATFHWHNDRPVHHLLDVLGRVNAETPIAKLRWSIAHLNDASPATLKRRWALARAWLFRELSA